MLIAALAAIILSGIAGGVIAFSCLGLLQRLRLEKKLKPIVSLHAVPKRGVTGDILFIAEKTGKYIQKNIRLRFMDTLARDISLKLTLLGGPYERIAAHTVIGIGVIAGFIAALIAAAAAEIYNPFLLFIIAAGAAALPYLFLKEKGEARHRALFRQIPDLLDLLILMIEAGLDFTAALNRIIAAEKGPLIDEFRRTHQQIQLGKPRAEAYAAMAERVRYLPLTTVLNALTLSFRTGGSITPTLRTLAEQFRAERFQRAEKTAMEAPLKLMVPLVLLIFPTVFIILFGPILLSFLYGNGF